MQNLKLTLASGEDTLSVRRFAVREGLSQLFDVSVWARSPDEDIDLETIVGRPAAFTIEGGLLDLFGTRRRVAGVCRHMELVEVEASGLTTYRLEIAPHLWLLTQRHNHRLFQRLRIPDILDALLTEWGIVPEWRLRREAHPKLELRVQYGETDFAFFSRLAEEAGISWFFVDADQGGSRLVLTDTPQTAEPRLGLLPYVDNPTQAREQAYVSRVRIARGVRPGKIALRDHDFRRSPRYELLGAPPAAGLAGVEDQLEVYRYHPGASRVELDDAGGPPPPAAAAPPAYDEPQPRTEPKGPTGPTQPAAPGVAQKLGHLLADKVSQMVDKAITDLPGKAGDLVSSKVDALVEKKVGGLAGNLLGNLVGGLAGSVASKVAAKIATSLHGPRDVPAGDDRGVVRHDDKAAHRRSQIELESVRATAFTLDLATNVVDLVPGTVFSIAHHPRADLGPTERLLVVRLAIDGAPGEDWSARATAAFARFPYRPALVTDKPVMQGVQSAIVVGPKGEEIHTDELGRVRVQFHWDREGRHDEQSSCWMRVSQGWAGAGYGMITVPRVGQEVLVAFLEGDPDLPVVVGTVFNGTARTPHHLPDHKTRSAWRGCSSPGGAGANEIMMDDAAGREMVYLHAERDMQVVARHDRGAVVGRADSTLVGERWGVQVAQPAEPPPSIGPTAAVIVDRRITFTTGEASITLDGPDITIEAKGKIIVRSQGDDVVLKGGPRLLLNCSPAVDRPAPAAAPGATGPAGQGATGPAGAAATPPKVTTGLGAGVDQLASQSPTLVGKIEQMQKDGWTIEYGAAGGGSYADKRAKKVIIDQNYRGMDTVVTQILAHESGHATYQADPYVPHTGLTRQEYVDRNVMSSLKDEGEATLTNIQVRDEIKAAGGGDIGVNGSQSQKYREIAAKYPDAKDRDRAREEIGRIFSTGEIPSTDVNSNYGRYYAKGYEEFYDRMNPPTPPSN